MSEWTSGSAAKYPLGKNKAGTESVLALPTFFSTMTAVATCLHEQILQLGATSYFGSSHTPADRHIP